MFKEKWWQISTVFCLYLFASCPVLANTVYTFTSSTNKTHLLELYSTQSCSSCPPAQAWVSELKQNQGLWKQFVPVVYHVDYWDYLGWKDPYSKPEFSERQRKYAKIWQSRSVYTPMFVLDGKEWRSRSMEALAKKGKSVGELIVKNQQGNPRQFTVNFIPAQANISSLQVHVALLGNDIKTNVTAGENSGKALQHEFIVLYLQTKSFSRMNNQYQQSFLLPLEQPKYKQAKSVAFWVSDTKSMQPVQATGGLL